MQRSSKTGRKVSWARGGTAGGGQSQIRIASTLLPGPQRTYCPRDGIFLSTSFPLPLEQIIRFENTKQSLRKQEPGHTPSSLTRAGGLLGG